MEQLDPLVSLVFGMELRLGELRVGEHCQEYDERYLKEVEEEGGPPIFGGGFQPRIECLGVWIEPSAGEDRADA